MICGSKKTNTTNLALVLSTGSASKHANNSRVHVQKDRNFIIETFQRMGRVLRFSPLAFQLLLKAFAFKELSSGYKTSSSFLFGDAMSRFGHQPTVYISLCVDLCFQRDSKSILAYIYYSVDFILTLEKLSSLTQ